MNSINASHPMAAIAGGPAAREKESAVLAAAIEKRIEEDRQSTADPFADETATTTPTGSESS